MSLDGYAIAPYTDILCHFCSTSTSIFTLALVSFSNHLLFFIALNWEKSAGEPLFITVPVSSLVHIGFFLGFKKNSHREHETIERYNVNPGNFASIALARRSNLRCG